MTIRIFVWCILPATLVTMAAAMGRSEEGLLEL
jgi:hypothetical protein